MSERFFFCKHFTGVQHGACAVGVDYQSVCDKRPAPERYRWPCLTTGNMPAATECAKREMQTDADLDVEDAAFEAVRAAVAAGVSPCCKAPLDRSHVDASGTGPRFCSACKELVFRGCNRIGKNLP